MNIWNKLFPGFGGGAPAAPEPAPVVDPKVEADKAAKARQAERLKQRKRRGRQASILTSPGGGLGSALKRPGADSDTSLG